MATIEEILTKARNADAAGDYDAARRLVGLAKSMSGAGRETSAPSPTAATDSESRLLGFDVRGGATAPQSSEAPSAPAGAFATTRDMVAEPWAATRQYLSGVLHPRESAVGKGIARDSTYVPGWSDVAASAANLGGAALSGLHTVMAGGAGLAGDAIGALGASKTRQNQLANDLMGMVESQAGTLPMASTEAAAARAALKADQKINSAAGAAKDLGITPSLGMTGKTGGMAAAALEKFPVTGPMVARDAARAVGEVEGALRKVIPGGLSAQSAGEMLQKGLNAFVAKFKSHSNDLFDKVADHIPPETRVPVTNMRAAIDKTKQYFTENPELANKLGLGNWDAVMAEAQTNGISWQGVRQLRTKIGDAIGSNRGALADEDVGRLKQLYGALTADMEAAAKAAGPEAYRAWSRANTFYKTGANRIERSLDATISAKNPERAFEAFDALTQVDRSTADLTRMRQIKASMSRDDWAQISQSIAARLGKAKAGAQNAEGSAFSPATFLTEWNKMSPEARRILFDEPVRVELEKIAKVAERVKAGNLERNTSNTGTVAATVALMNGLMHAPVTTVTAGTVTALSAKAMTSPMFLRAVNNAMSGDMKAIEAMAKGRGPYAEDAAILMRMAASETHTGSAANSTEPPRAAINR